MDKSKIMKTIPFQIDFFILKLIFQSKSAEEQQRPRNTETDIDVSSTHSAGATIITNSVPTNEDSEVNLPATNPISSSSLTTSATETLPSTTTANEVRTISKVISNH